jgi:glycosyltransferase involved in cell wall biosynthesis
MRICVDLTPLEMVDRHGGIGRYTVRLLEQLLSLPCEDKKGLEILGLMSSLRPPIPGEQALEEARRERRQKEVPFLEHWLRRRCAMGAFLRASRVALFHSTEMMGHPMGVGCPVVTTSYDLVPIVAPMQPRSVPFALWASTTLPRYKAVYRKPTHIIAISGRTKRDIVTRLGIPEARVTVVHLGVDAHTFSSTPADPGERARTRLEHGLPESWFICVSSDHYRKNHRRLFDAWCKVTDRIPEGLVLVGRPLYESTFHEIESEAAARGLGARFRWLRNLDDAALPPLYRHATAAVAPSLYEGFGMTILEAMACGTPVIAARNGAYDEVGGPDALYFDPTNVDEIADALAGVSSDAARRADLRERGLLRSRVATWTRTARATLDVYRRVAGVS